MASLAGFLKSLTEGLKLKQIETRLPKQTHAVIAAAIRNIQGLEDKKNSL
jgi:uncharacterized BrkB/YihY/UPF0761 family membrane protein